MFWWFLGSNAVNCPELYPEKTCFRIFPQINPSLPSFLASLCIQRYTLNSKRTWKSSFLGIWSIPFGAFSAYFSRGANWLLVSGSASKLESWSDDEAKNSVASLGPIFVFFWISCIKKNLESHPYWVWLMRRMRSVGWFGCLNLDVQSSKEKGQIAGIVVQ